MRILGINAVFHDPAAAIVVDGTVVAAAEEERFSRRKHGKSPVPFSTWELPEKAAAWCLQRAGLDVSELDAVAYSYDPTLVDASLDGVDAGGWEKLRTLYARRAPEFLKTALPGLDPGIVRFVRHHVAHAASAALASPFGDCAVLTSDGRGESESSVLGEYRDGKFVELAHQSLPHSLGLTYEVATAHLGFQRSSDEYKVMALASYGTPRFLPELRELVFTTGDGGFRTAPIDWERFAPARSRDDEFLPEHADLAASVQRVTEEVLLDLARWLHERTGHTDLALAGGTALNCVANTRLHAEGPFERVWVQPAAGDAGTALGAALQLAADFGEAVEPMGGADLGRGLERRRAGGVAATGRRAVRALRRHRRDRRGRARRRRDRGVVPGPGGVRAPGARPPVAARPPRACRESGAAQRREGAGAVPARGPDGARRPRARTLLPRSRAEPVHALRARRRSTVA